MPKRDKSSTRTQSDSDQDPQPSKAPRSDSSDKLERLLSDPSIITDYNIEKCCDVLDLFKNISDKRTINRYLDLINIASSTIRTIATKLQNIENMHDMLKEIKEDINCKNNQPIPSFAQIVKREPHSISQPISKQEEKTIIVKPNNETSPHLIENKIKAILKKSNKKIKINKIYSKQKCVIIKTPNDEQISDDLINQINSHDNTKNECTAYSPKMRDPTILLKNVSCDIDLLNLTQQIVDCNEELADSKEEMKFLFKMKYGDHTAKHMSVVLRVSPKVHHIITNQLNNRIYLDYQCCNIQTKLFVRQCQKCFKFNHRTQDCNSQAVCKNCGQEKHSNHTCSGSTSCINCKNSIKHKNNTDHSPNTDQCPLYKLQWERLCEQTQFHP